MDHLLIRTATITDTDKLVELWISMQHHMEKSNQWIWRITEEGKAGTRDRVRKAVIDDGSLVAAADVRGKVVGFAHGKVLSRNDFLPRNVGMIASIYVDKDLRRAGVGRRLVERLCRFFRSKDAKHVTLRYVKGNAEGEQFWKSLGFEPTIVTASTHLDDLERLLRHDGLHKPLQTS